MEDSGTSWRYTLASLFFFMGSVVGFVGLVIVQDWKAFTAGVITLFLGWIINPPRLTNFGRRDKQYAAGYQHVSVRH